MVHRTLVFAAALALINSTALLAQPGNSWTAPRTADGHPDLQGIWTNATLTPLERPAALASKPTLTAAEAQALAKRNIEAFNIDRRGGGAESDVARAYNNL